MSSEKPCFSRPDIFMTMAQMMAERSVNSDPEIGGGAVVVTDRDIIIGTGYDSMPEGKGNRRYAWNKERSSSEHKHLYVVHAAKNAFTHLTAGDCSGGYIYMTRFPCNDCAQIITQKEISEVIYLSDAKNELIEYQAAKRIFDGAGIKYRQFETDIESITISMDASKRAEIKRKDNV